MEEVTDKDLWGSRSRVEVCCYEIIVYKCHAIIQLEECNVLCLKLM